MLQERKLESFFDLLTVCEQVVGGNISKNVPLAIGLNLYIAQCRGSRLDRNDLIRLVATAPSIFDRYLSVLETQGVIETSSGEAPVNSEIKLSASARQRFESIFDKPDS